MSVTWGVERDNVGVFRISGQLRQTELASAQHECETLIRKFGHVKILIVLEDFEGWERAEGWEDMSFTERNDPFIQKVAIVGDAKWRDLVYAFAGKGFRPVPIQYFEADQQATARQWLDTA